MLWARNLRSKALRFDKSGPSSLRSNQPRRVVSPTMKSGYLGQTLMSFREEVGRRLLQLMLPYLMPAAKSAKVLDSMPGNPRPKHLNQKRPMKDSFDCASAPQGPFLIQHLVAAPMTPK